MPDLTTFGQPWRWSKTKRDADLITLPVTSLSDRWVPDQAGPLRFYYPIRSWRIRSATQLRYELDDPLHVLWTGRIRSHGRSKETVESDTPSGPILHLERSAELLKLCGLKYTALFWCQSGSSLQQFNDFRSSSSNPFYHPHRTRKDWINCDLFLIPKYHNSGFSAATGLEDQFSFFFLSLMYCDCY